MASLNPEAVETAPIAGAVVGSLRERFKRGVLWSMGAAVATSGFNFLVNIVIARVLGREGFGEFGMVQSTVATVSGTAQVAMGYTATKFVAEFRSSDPAKAGRIIALCSVVSALTGSIAATTLYAGARYLADTSLNAPHLAAGLRLSAPMVFFTVLVGYQLGALAGLERYRTLAAIALAGGGANIVAAGVGARFWGLNGAIGGMALASAVQWLACRSLMDVDCRRAGIHRSLRHVWQERSVFLSFALPAALGGLSSMPAVWLANAFLVRRPGGFSEMALYSAALSLRSLVFFLPTLFNRVSMSLLNNQKGIANWSGYRRVFKANIVMTASTVLIAAGLVSVFGGRVLGVFGQDFRVGYTVLVAVLISALPEALAMAIVQVVHSQARLWLSLFAIALPKDCSLVLLSYFLIPRHGATGLATAYALAWSLTLLLVIIAAQRSWPVHARDDARA